MKAQYSFSGRVIGSDSIPLEFATIAILKSSDSTLIGSCYTDAKGSYTISTIIPGNYILKTFLIGYSDNFFKIEIKEHDYKMPDIILKISELNLNEITINAIKKRIEFKNGNLVFNTEDNSLLAGNSVYEALKKIPTIYIDNNQDISIQGTPGAKVYIDGRLQQLSSSQVILLLKAMNINIVSKIEILKNPPSKYDASGTAGIINIVTKDAVITGLNGNVNLNTSQGFYNWGGLGLALNYKARKFSFFSSADISNVVTGEWNKLGRTITDNDTTTTLSQSRVSKATSLGYMYRVGLDYYLTKNTIIGVLLEGEQGFYNDSWTTKNIVSGNTDLKYNLLLNKVYNPLDWKNNNYNINMETRLDTLGSMISFSSDYNKSLSSFKSNIINDFYDNNFQKVAKSNNYRNEGISFLNLYSGKIDFRKMMKYEIVTEIGAKASYLETNKDFLFERQDNNSLEFYKDLNLSNQFKYQEKIFAGYINFEKQIKKISFQLGLRGEQTYIYGNNSTSNIQFSRNYFNIYPNVTLGYKHSDNHEYNINYNKRIDRPDYEDLNPFLYYWDQYTSFQGNQLLMPQYSNRFDFSYTYKGIYSNSLTYSKVKDKISSLTIQNDSTKEFLVKKLNLNYLEKYSYSSFLQLSPKSWYDLSASIVVFYTNYNMTNLGIGFRNNQITFLGNINNEFLIKKFGKLQAGIGYRGPQANGIISEKSIFTFNIGINKQFMKDKLDVNISIDDVFWSEIERTYTRYSNQNWDYIGKSDSRRFKISLLYNFGKSKITEREVNSNSEEKNRIK